MSSGTTQSEPLAAATEELQGIGTTLRVQNAAAVAPMTGVVPPAADPVSALTAAQFVAQAQMFQQISAQAAVMRETLVNTLGLISGSSAATKAAGTIAAGEGVTE